jgi:hypothetical protein
MKRKPMTAEKRDTLLADAWPVGGGPVVVDDVVAEKSPVRLGPVVAAGPLPCATMLTASTLISVELKQFVSSSLGSLLSSLVKMISTHWHMFSHRSTIRNKDTYIELPGAVASRFYHLNARQVSVLHL